MSAEGSPSTSFKQKGVIDLLQEEGLKLETFLTDLCHLKGLEGGENSLSLSSSRGGNQQDASDTPVMCPEPQ